MIRPPALFSSVSSRSKLSARCAETRPPAVQLPGDAQGHVAFAGDDALGVIQAGGVDPLRALLTRAPWPWLSSAPPRLMASSPSLLERGAAGVVVQAPACHRRPLPSGEQAGAGVAQRVGRRFPGAMMRPCWRCRCAWPAARSPAGWKSRRPGGCRGRSAASMLSGPRALIRPPWCPGRRPQVETDAALADQPALALHQALDRQAQVARAEISPPSAESTRPAVSSSSPSLVSRPPRLSGWRRAQAQRDSPCH